MNSIRSIANEKCTGCEVCGHVCNQKAISFKEDGEGFLFPVINNEKCINCGKCLKYCSANNTDSFLQSHNDHVYAVSLNDTQELLKSSSGGVAYALMCAAIEMGMIVFGVQYDDNFKGCHYSVACNVDDLQQFRGTKYIQAKKNDIFVRIREVLKKGKDILFIGLPCEVTAVRKLFSKYIDKIIYVELICHGVTSSRVAREYVEKKETIYGPLEWMTIREKKYGWAPACIKMIYKNRKVKSTLFDSTEYGYAFRNLSRPSCYQCKNKGDARNADISIGDYWGVTCKDVCWNKNGVSVAFLHNKVGKNLFNRISKVTITEITYDKGVLNNSAILRPRSIGKRNDFSQDYITHDIFYARKKNETCKEFVIRLLRGPYYRFCYFAKIKKC